MSGAMAGAQIRIDVVYAEQASAWRLSTLLPAGTRVGEVIACLPGMAPGWPAAAFSPAALAVYGREVSADTVLGDGDRLELLRALPTDPKLARRTRAQTGKPR